jgi:hypothetical protein
MINYDRTFQSSTGPQETASRGLNLFIQDQFTVGDRLSFNLGIRAEKYAHFATDGEEISFFPWEWAPRLSATYDVLGNGRHKASAYWGRYYDPIRNDMTNFAGTLTGSTLEEQVFILGDWVTYRTRGGPQVQDALFSPTTQTPYTDDLQLGYAVDLGRSMSLEANVIRRETRDVLEDYDLFLYSDPQGYGLPVDHPESLFIPVDYFGFGSIPPSNFIIGTLLGGERDWDGVELIFRKRFSNNWQMLASYNYADGEGSTNSDSNADFQGDVLWLDPRAPNQFGTQPGLIEHLFKIAGSYQWNNGIQVGGAYRWNSGVIISRTFSASGRHLPLLDTNDTQLDCNIINGVAVGPDCVSFAGQDGTWLSPVAVGQFENPEYGVLDLRFAYLWDLQSVDFDFFVDVFNALDDQATIREQDLIAGGGGANFGEGLEFVEPRRFFLGARLRF